MSKSEVTLSIVVDSSEADILLKQIYEFVRCQGYQDYLVRNRYVRPGHRCGSPGFKSGDNCPGCDRDNEVEKWIETLPLAKSQPLLSESDCTCGKAGGCGLHRFDY